VRARRYGRERAHPPGGGSPVEAGHCHLGHLDAGIERDRCGPRVKVVFITMHADPAYVRAAFEAGASAYLLKRCVGEELGQAVRAVQSGNFYVTPLVTKEVVEGMLRGVDGGSPAGPELTTRQREVLQLLAEGHTVKDIAGALKISPRTVEFHKGQIMEQLDLHTTVELVKYALAQGLTGHS